MPQSLKYKLKLKMLEPVEVNGKSYANFLEETVRRITQSIQPISGNIAELCATRRFKINDDFGNDMLYFMENGHLP